MTPTIDNALHRIRSYFASSGMNTHQIATAAGVHWTAAAKVLNAGALPSLESVKRVETLVPPDFIPPDPHASPGAPDDWEAINGRGCAVLCNQTEEIGQ